MPASVKALRSKLATLHKNFTPGKGHPGDKDGLIAAKQKLKAEIKAAEEREAQK